MKNRIKGYYETLAISKEQVEALPKITGPIKKIMAGLEAKNLPHDVYYYLEVCPEPHIRKILSTRKRVNRGTPLEALCAAAEVDPTLVLQSVLSAIERLTAYNSAAILAAGKEQVADVLVNAALLPEGTEDRALFMKATGMLPQPKGAQTLIQVTQNSSMPTAVVVAPSPDKTIKRLSDRFNQLQLPPPEAIDVFTEEDESEA